MLDRDTSRKSVLMNDLMRERLKLSHRKEVKNLTEKAPFGVNSWDP